MEDIGSTLRQMHGWMNDYMKSFYSDDDEVQLGIVLKEKHTGYVTSNARQLAEHLRLEEHDVALAEIVGLFHDVGRFAQYSKYKTFNDAESEDHADLGAQVLEEFGYTVSIQKDLHAGDNYVLWESKEIETCKNFIAVWSQAYAQSGNCQQELTN